MTEAGAVPETERLAAALAATAELSVPVDADAYEGVRGDRLDALTGQLDALHAESAGTRDGATAALVAARLGRCLALRFALTAQPDDRERALELLETARACELLDREERTAADRALGAMLGSRLFRLHREFSGGSQEQWSLQRMMDAFAVGVPAAQGGSGVLEDSLRLVRLLLERDRPGLTPEARRYLRDFDEVIGAALDGDTDVLARRGRQLVDSTPGFTLPPSLRAVLPAAFGLLEDASARPAGDAGPSDLRTAGARLAAEPLTESDWAQIAESQNQLLALTEAMAPGTLAEEDLAELIARLTGTGETGPASGRSRLIAALLHFALAVRTGDMEGFRTALGLMRDAYADGELDAAFYDEWLRAIVPGVLLGASLTGGSLQDQETAWLLLEAQRWDDAAASGTSAVSLRLCGAALRLNFRLMSALDDEDGEAVEDVVEALCELELDDAYDDAEDWIHVLVGFLLGAACLGTARLAGSREEVTDRLRAAVHHFQQAVDSPVDMPAMRALLDASWAPLITLTAIAENDPGRIAEGVRRTRTALESPGFTSDFRSRVRSAAAIALHTQYTLTRDPAPLDEAVAELEQAVTELPDGVPGGADLRWDLAALRAERAAVRPGTPEGDGDLRAAVALARTSLRLAADDVLLQQGVGHGLRIARAAADRGRRAAFWAVRAGLLEEAVEALEAGRSLVLGAAAVSAGVADRLADLGERELAERWRGTATPSRTAASPLERLARARSGSPLELLTDLSAGTLDVPGGLRRRSLELLRGRDGADDTRPASGSAAALRAGLRETGADALVHLVPGVDEQDGAVLVLAPDGPVHALPLAALTPAGRAPVTDYLAAGAHRQRLAAAADDPDGPDVNEREVQRAERRWLQALDRMCEWAGAVLAPVLDHLGVWGRALTEAGLVAGPAGTGSAAAVRLVLVPCGELGVVPWQAAVLTPPARHHVPRTVRACEITVLTHAACGREFLRAAARRRMDPADRPALVFHGYDDLAWAEEEVDTLADVYYPGAVVHRPDEHPATPETVLALLGGRAAAPASLVHLACHGLAGPDPAGSALKLAAPDGNDGADLTLSTLLETPAEGDAFRSAGPLVVCGGCETDLTTRDHDEALTVTSVMVHRLAADAVGSRWQVDDRLSEILMLVLHDALARGLAPPDALRAAQRWMLTPPGDRPAVRGLAHLTGRGLGEELRDRPHAWAAFVHQGNPAPAARSARPQEGERP
ncbi:CHAT domain-containing protein [Streptomyces seoulensis]|nr:CHAT domain-containing protein [Streptomyces seoulensis]